MQTRWLNRRNETTGVDERFYPITHKDAVVGLDKVDNTSDMDKPVSTAQKAAIDAVQTNVNTVNDKVDDHIDNEDIHFTAAERTKLAGIEPGAEMNQNAFAKVVVGSSTIEADSKTDSLTFAGENITITADTTNDKVSFIVPTGSTSAKGVVQLTNSTSSTSTTTAATPSSVKSAYDLANTANNAAIAAQATADGKSDKGHKHIVSEITDLTATATELNYVDGVTSNIQTQLDGKADSNHTHTAEDVGAVQREIFWYNPASHSDKLVTFIWSLIDQGYTSGVIQVDGAYTAPTDVPTNVTDKLGTYYICEFQKHGYGFVDAILSGDGAMLSYRNKSINSDTNAWQHDWVESFNYIGYLPLTGGTLSANDIYMGGGVGRIWGGADSASLQIWNNAGDSKTFRGIQISNSDLVSDKEKAYVLLDRVNGSHKEYQIYGEHNTVPVKNGGTGGTDRNTAFKNLAFLGHEPIASITDDTMTNWGALGSGYATYSTLGLLNDQPNQYGFLINYTDGGVEVCQIWIVRPTGEIYVRGANGSGWNRSWKKVFDASHAIPVANGGTGVKTLASGAVLIGNGTGAVQTRTINDSTSPVDVSGNSIPTCNTLRQHVQYWLNRGAAVHQANTGYTTYMARGIALLTAVPSSMTNGTVAFIYQ